VYWANQSPDGGANPESIVKVPLGGGSLTVLASGRNNPLDIAVSGTDLYWTDYAAPEDDVARMSINGGAVTVLSPTADNPTTLLISGGFVYFGNRAATPSGVYRVPVDGGTTTSLAGLTSDTVWGIAVNSLDVYFAGHNLGGLYKVVLAGGTATLVASVADVPAGDSVEVGSLDSTNVYLAEQVGGGSVLQVAMDGGAVTTLAANQHSPCYPVVDPVSSYVYWANGGGPGAGSVAKVPIGGGTITVLSSGNTPNFVAINSTSLFWTDIANGTVMKLTPR
jgi:hypothetical protein